MKKFVALSFLVGALNVNAAEVVSEIKDTSIGEGYGSLSEVMMGAAAGGPIGAVAGAVAGAFGGGSVQGATHTQQRTYMVRTDSGEIRRYRSPIRMYAVGDQVKILRGRIHPVDEV